MSEQREYERTNEIMQALIKFFKAARVPPMDPVVVHSMASLCGSIMAKAEIPEVSLIIQDDENPIDRYRVRITIDRFTN